MLPSRAVARRRASRASNPRQKMRVQGAVRKHPPTHPTPPLPSTHPPRPGKCYRGGGHTGARSPLHRQLRKRGGKRDFPGWRRGGGAGAFCPPPPLLYGLPAAAGRGSPPAYTPPPRSSAVRAADPPRRVNPPSGRRAGPSSGGRGRRRVVSVGTEDTLRAAPPPPGGAVRPGPLPRTAPAAFHPLLKKCSFKKSGSFARRCLN